MLGGSARRELIVSGTWIQASILVMLFGFGLCCASSARASPGQPDLRLVGEAGRLDRALMLTRRRRPDVLVIDAEIPGLDAVSAIRALRKQTPESAIVVISLEPDRLRPVVRDHERALAIGKVEGADAPLSAIRELGSTGPG